MPGVTETTYPHKIVHPATDGAVPALKWYHLAPEREPVEPDVAQSARVHIAGLGTADDGGDGEAGFVILHRCSDDFYFLLLCTWMNGNELWQRVMYRDREDPEFRDYECEALHPTFCVWELGIVWFEQQAWRRHLGNPSAESRNEYLTTQLEGDV